MPQAHPNLVPRPRLGELLLNEGMGRKLTLISAPAGFGKTTLLSEWRMMHLGGDYPLAWVSLEEADNDPACFLSYLVAALQTIEADVGESVLASLRSPQPTPIESLLAALINDIGAVSQEFALVLDDYHVIEAQPIHDAIAFLLDHLPPQLHFVISTRSDPPLPLARLRARGQMTELRAADLRFTAEEASLFLRNVMGLDLSAREVKALEERTEGWIAGLQLAALSMRGREDLSGFIEAFTGSNRYVLDYLVEEVLARQPDLVTSFLLQTSILDRLSGELCDALTQEDASQEMLETLERENLFLFALDEERRWYRYHHLFAEVLRHHLRRTQPASVADLHSRASTWHEQNGFIDEAIRHALAARDAERAARLVERNAEAAVVRSEVATLARWLGALPDKLVRSRPRLCVARAVTLLVSGRPDAVEAYLQDAERALARAPEGRFTERSGGWLADLPGAIAVIRGTLARRRGDVSRVIDLSRWSLAYLPEDSVFLRSIVAWDLGTTHRMTGDMEEAGRIFAELVRANRAAGEPYIALLAMYELGEVRVIQGRLREAEETYRQGLRIAAERGGSPLPAVGMAHVGLGDLLRERDELEAAALHLTEGIQLCERLGYGEPLSAAYAALARVKQAQGDASATLEAMDRAQQASPHADLTHPFDPVAAPWVRLLLARGEVEAAARWARAAPVGLDDDPSFGREAEHITLARVLLAQDCAGEALGLLERLGEAAEAGARTGRVIEILVLQALALQAQGDTQRAMSALARALLLAEPEGYVRLFVDEGAPMAALLRQAVVKGVSPGYASCLLEAFGSPAEELRSGALSERLSERELEILRLVAAGMSNAQIAREAFVAVSTVKKHISNIYRKLDVNSRTRAVARARELKLL